MWTCIRVALVAAVLLALACAASANPTEATRLTAQFASMTGSGWTGGDAAWSARLPDGRDVWLFGDTFLGGVDATGRRAAATPMVRNSMVVGGRTIPDVVDGARPDRWYWPGPGVVGRSTLQVPMAQIARTGPGAWDFAATGTSVAVFRLPGLGLRTVKSVATPPGVNMASAAATTRRFTYVYGTRNDGPLLKSAFVARVRGRDLRRRWAYWTGSRWSANPNVAAPIARGVSDQFSVIRHGRVWLLVTQLPFSRKLVAFRSSRPQGPWTGARELAEIPAIPHAITYNAIVHPEYSHGRTLTIGYCVNGQTEDWVYANAALYRPRFISVRI